MLTLTAMRGAFLAEKLIWINELGAFWPSFSRLWQCAIEVSGGEFTGTTLTPSIFGWLASFVLRNPHGKKLLPQAKNHVAYQ